MNTEEDSGNSANDLALLDQASDLAGNDTKLGEILGQSVAMWRNRAAIPRPWAIVLRWYIYTGHVEPPEAPLVRFLNFTRGVASRKQLRKVVLALAETEDEREMFDKAMTAAVE